mmetsp:Transcript_57205/g.147143  ORF Transcript_57205/g.147143 Transcript_57205/m.147143 type:complete len:167 (-) Transcript_57205:31-531(-)
MGQDCSCEDSSKQDEKFVPAVSSEDQVMPEGAITQAQDVSKFAPRSGAPAVASGAPKANRERTQEKPRVFEFVIKKLGPDDKLGMDVKHVHHRLEVVHVFPDGAIERTNQTNRAKSPMGETLNLGDVIEKVNNVENSDHQMVAECRLRDELVFIVSRSNAPTGVTQ